MVLPSGDHFGSSSFRSIIETIFLRSYPFASQIQSSCLEPDDTEYRILSADREYLGCKMRFPISTIGTSSLLSKEYFQIPLEYPLSPFVWESTKRMYFPSGEILGE